jgi:hypothetical protein
MSAAALNLMLGASLLLSVLAGLAGLLLERAARSPALTMATVVLAVFGLSWAGMLLMGE